MRVIAIIPARYASTRFPAKPLAVLGRKCIIEWVYDAAKRYFDRVVVATDDRRIAEAVEAFGGEWVMTSEEHRCGTERCAEAVERIGGEYDIVVNIQGDEPFINAEQLEALVTAIEREDVDIATLATPIDSSEALHNPNVVKVVMTPDGRALYFSRSPIPHLRGYNADEWHTRHRYYQHVGIYAFRRATLGEVVRLAPTPLESAESLEQLRWMERGYTIGVGITDHRSIGIDTPEDLAAAHRMLGLGD